MNRQREEEARRIDALKEAAVALERQKAELRRRQREKAAARRVAKEKVACVQLMRQLLPLSLDAAMADLTKNSWVTPTAHQVRDPYRVSVWVMIECRSRCLLSGEINRDGSRSLLSTPWLEQTSQGRSLAHSDGATRSMRVTVKRWIFVDWQGVQPGVSISMPSKPSSVRGTSTHPGGPSWGETPFVCHHLYAHAYGEPLCRISMTSPIRRYTRAT